jgi:hypothetical protein
MFALANVEDDDEQCYCCYTIAATLQLLPLLLLESGRMSKCVLVGRWPVANRPTSSVAAARPLLVGVPPNEVRRAL